jgi:dihydrofolate reductase
VNGLVDELRLMVFPVSIGGGLRVFPNDRTKLAWTLADQVTFPSGVMALTFIPA